MEKENQFDKNKNYFILIFYVYNNKKDHQSLELYTNTDIRMMPQAINEDPKDSNIFRRRPFIFLFSPFSIKRSMKLSPDKYGG